MDNQHLSGEPLMRLLWLSLCMAIVAPLAIAQTSLTYQNPVYSRSMPDPGVFEHKGRYYAVGTTGNKPLEDGRRFQVLSSGNLVDWKDEGGALLTPVGMERHEFWAPEVVEQDGKFYLYYSVGTLDDLKFEIRVATSNSPTGPYTDTGKPLKDGEGAAFFIDGHAFQDDDGEWYFFYAKDFLDTNDGYRSGTGIVVDRLIDMKRLEGKPKRVVRPRYDWTLFEANRTMSMYGGRQFDWHTIEAPWVVKRDGKYWCFYSGSNFGTEHYGLDYVVADNVMGPYEDQGEYARVLRGVPNLVRGPGHHSIARSPVSGEDIIVYHAWNPDMTVRQMCVDPLTWTRYGPRCVGPTVNRADLKP